MKKVKFFVALFFIKGSFLFSSCETPKDESQILLQQLSDQLDKSTESINRISLTSLKSLDSKTFELSMMGKANDWLSKANQIRTLSVETYTYLDSLKKNVKLGNTLIDSSSIIPRMSKYVDEVSKIDSGLTKQFQQEISSIPSFESLHNLISTHPSPWVALSLLSWMQNRISILENDLLKYCDLKVSSSIFVYNTRVPLINQNRLYLRAKEELEVNIGLGYLDYPSTPKIYAGNESLSRNDSGFYIYKTKVGEKAGKYQIPIRFEYYDYNFEKIIMNRTVVYIVE